MSKLHGDVPWYSPAEMNNPELQKELMQRFGASDATDVVVRNLEREYIQSQSALMSIANGLVPSQALSNLHILENQRPGGGVSVRYPLEPTNLGETEADKLKDMGSNYIHLERGNVTYHVLHEAIFESGNMAENDLIAEAAEQMAAKMDNIIITGLKEKKFAANSFDADNTWTTTGRIYDDINKATTKIIENSAINVNSMSGNGSFFSCILPIALRETMQKREVIDGVKTTIQRQVEENLNTKILYTRKPFFGEVGNPLTNEALIVPTNDRKVGRLYTFNGGSAFPTTYQTSNENGKRVSQNSWWKFAVAANEKDGSTTNNRRIAVIGDIISSS